MGDRNLTRAYHEFLLVFVALAIQESLGGGGGHPFPYSGRNLSEKSRISQDTINNAANAAVNGLCNCAAPIPQWMNSLYNAGETCFWKLGLGAPTSLKATCAATALGLLNEDGSVASIDLFKAVHGGSDEFDAALDDCYANSFGANNDVVEASIAFDICIELAIADMCNIPLARHELLLTTEAMSRDI